VACEAAGGQTRVCVDHRFETRKSLSDVRVDAFVLQSKVLQRKVFV
jgi:hypothetical protein